jgi:hypothetical protein
MITCGVCVCVCVCVCAEQSLVVCGVEWDVLRKGGIDIYMDIDTRTHSLTYMHTYILTHTLTHSLTRTHIHSHTHTHTQTHTLTFFRYSNLLTSAMVVDTSRVRCSSFSSTRRAVSTSRCLAMCVCERERE